MGDYDQIQKVVQPYLPDGVSFSDYQNWVNSGGTGPLGNLTDDQKGQMMQNITGAMGIRSSRHSTGEALGQWGKEIASSVGLAYGGAALMGDLGAGAGAAAGATGGGGAGGLTGVNYAGTYLPQIASGSGAAAGSAGGGGLLSSLFGGGGAATGGGMGLGLSGWTNIAGLVSGLLGSKLQADATSNAANTAANAAAYRPYNYGSAGGNVLFGPGNQVSSQFNPDQQSNYNLLGQLTQQYLGGTSPTSGYQNFSNAIGNNGIQSLFASALGQSSQLPTGQYANTMNQLNGLGGQVQGTLGGVLGALGQSPYSGIMQQILGQGQGLYGQGNSLFGQGQGMYGQGSDLVNQGVGMLGQGANLFGNSLNLASPFINSGQNLFGQAQALAGQDTSGLVNNQLSLLRQQAAPQEAQQLSSLRDTLFGQGRLGAGDNTIGGANPEMQALFNSFGQADLGRQITANQLGLQAQQQNTATAGLLGNLGSSQNNLGLNYAGLGQNAGQGLLGASQGLFGAGQSQYNAGQGLYGAGANSYSAGQGLYNNAGNFANLDNSRTLGLLGQLPGLFNAGGNFATQGYNTATNFSDLGNTRSQQDLQNAMNLFGFGTNLNNQDVQTGINTQTGQNNLQAMLNAIAQMGGTFGTQQANAGANQAQAYLTNNGSPLGGLLSGFGAGLINRQQPLVPTQQPVMAGIGSPNWMPGPTGAQPLFGE